MNEENRSSLPFRLLDLPIEVQIHIIHIIVQSSIDPSLPHQHQLGPNEDDVGEDRPTPINWSILINLASTCRSLYELCCPFYLRRLVISPRSYPHRLSFPIGLVQDELQELSDLIQDHLTQRASSLRHVTTIFYGGVHRMRLTQPPPCTLDSIHQLLSATTKLRSLCLNSPPKSTATSILRHPLPTLEALSLSYITTQDEVDPEEFPCLERLRALKIQECAPDWLRIVKRTKKLEHLCVWMPMHRIRDIDWFLPKVILPNLRYLNLDGFKDTPTLLFRLCDLIRAYRLEGGKFVIEELDLEARFTSRLVDKVLSAVEGYEGLKSFAISCVVGSDMNPDLFDAIGRAGIGPGLERLLVMVDGYEGRRWPGNLAHYAARLSRFTRLRSFAFNHVDDPGSMEVEAEAEADGELVIVDNSRSISPNFAHHASIIFGAMPNLKSVILVKSLWASSANGAQAWREAVGEEIQIQNQLDLRKTLIPFEPRWTD
ncbi:hypothetical protein DFH28DRAFT_1217983 [Melampsora americana]|nr:hypothetical protein DFH28DRAFT_1217983 [Melampsora americana]